MPAPNSHLRKSLTPYDLFLLELHNVLWNYILWLLTIVYNQNVNGKNMKVILKINVGNMENYFVDTCIRNQIYMHLKEVFLKSVQCKNHKSVATHFNYLSSYYTVQCNLISGN